MKKTRRSLSLILAMIMCVALAVPAFAEPLPEGVSYIAPDMSVTVVDGPYVMPRAGHTFYFQEELTSYATMKTVGCQAPFGNMLDININNEVSDVSIMLSVTSSGSAVLSGTVPPGVSRTFTISSSAPLTSHFDILFAPAPTSHSTYTFVIRQHDAAN